MRRKSAFTLIEVMVAMAILGIVIGAIYSTWTGIVKASKVGLNAAAAAQRERMAMRVIEQSVAAAQLFVANPAYYSFEVNNDGSPALSFVAALQDDFPRSGKFGGAAMRRIEYSVEGGSGQTKQLVMRQHPILTDFDEDEKLHPVVLAQSVKTLQVELWDANANNWTDRWLYTNQLPKLVRVSLQLAYPGTRGQNSSPLLTTVVALPTAGVQPEYQLPQAGGAPPGGGGPGLKIPVMRH